MKVCHLTSLHSPNDIRIFIKECSSLAKWGFDTHFVVPYNDELDDSNGVKIHKVLKENTRIKRMLHTTKSVYQKALEINADVYHFHDPELIPVGLRLKRRGKHVIYDVHEDLPRAILSKTYLPKVFRKSISWFVEKYENYSSKKFDFIIGATPYITERFTKINKNSINVNNYPIQKELASDVSTDIIKENKVCFIGGIHIIRGAENIISSSKSISGEIVMAGPVSSTELKNKLLNSKVNYLGILNRNEVKELLSESIAGIVLFLPEPNHINSQPNKMFEYMSAGIPVLGSNFPLWKEIIEDNNCGICVNPENVEQISEAIQWFLNNPDKASEMGENGRKAVEEKYNWETESKKMIKLYQKLLVVDKK